MAKRRSMDEDDPEIEESPLPGLAPAAPAPPAKDYSELVAACTELFGLPGMDAWCICDTLPYKGLIKRIRAALK